MSGLKAERPDAGSGSVIARVIGWLSAGYPDGIPTTDRFAVVAVLKRRLSDDQVREIARELTSADSTALENGKIETDEIEELIRRELREDPSDNDIRRVSAHLAAGGWPLAGELEAADDPSVTPDAGESRA